MEDCRQREWKTGLEGRVCRCDGLARSCGVVLVSVRLCEECLSSGGGNDAGPSRQIMDRLCQATRAAAAQEGATKTMAIGTKISAALSAAGIRPCGGCKERRNAIDELI